MNGLEPGRTYHYRIVAANQGGEQVAYGQDETFTTPPAPPALAGVFVFSVTQSTATVIAGLDPQGLPTRYELQAGPTNGPLTTQATGNTTSPTAIGLSLTAQNLAPNTSYTYKLIATNPDGSTEHEGTFTTTPTTTLTPPNITTPPIPFLTPTQLANKENTEHHTTTKQPTRHELLLKALKHCKTNKNKHKRTTCEKQAHHKYGAPKKHT